MYCIGLTGNAGSGKSTALNYFQQLGIDVVSADKIAKELTAKNQPALQSIQDYFGAQVIDNTGELNRNYLREVIINNPQKKIWLEQLLHPLIRQQLYIALQATKSAYCVVEIPLLFSKQDYSYINRILLMQASPEIQIKRLAQRDGVSIDNAIALLATQPQDSMRLTLADDLIINIGSLHALQDSVLKLHELYLSYSKI